MKKPIQKILTIICLSLISCAGVSAQEPTLALVNARIMKLDTRSENPPVNGYILIDAEGRLAAVEDGPLPSEVKPLKTVNLKGAYILPGFISAHSHLWQSALRGLGADQTLFGWAEAVYTDHAQYTQPEDLYWFTLHGALDHIRNGITGAYNFNLTWDGSTSAITSKQQLAAEIESGLRFVHGYSLRWDSETDPDATVVRTQLKDFLDYTRNQKPDGLLSVMLNGSGSFMDAPRTALLEGQLMEEFAIGNHQHYLEAPDHKYSMQAKFKWFQEANSIGPNMLWGHFIHTTPEILKITAEKGAKMSWNPLSNGRLASGTPDIPLYLAMDIPVGMGVDGQASADLADPLANARTGLYAIRAMYEDATIMSPYDVLWLHTQGSANVLGVGEDYGSIEVGKQADLVVYDPTIWDVAPITNDYATLVFAMDSRHLSKVYIGGVLKFENGSLRDFNFDTVSAEVARRFSRIVEERELRRGAKDSMP